MTTMHAWKANVSSHVFKVSLLFLGTCMCVKCNVNYLVAGFEQGSIALFDFRKQLEAVSELKAHDDPGGNSYTKKDVNFNVLYIVMCVHCLDNGLGVTGSADDVLSVFMITEMVRYHACIIYYMDCTIYVAITQNMYFYEWSLA